MHSLSGFPILVVETFNRIKQEVSGSFGSPVWTGRYYSSHKITFGALDLSTSPETDQLRAYSELPDYSKEEFIQKFTVGETVYISNAVPYAIDIEEGIASQKTPEGVFGVSLTSAEAYFVSQGARAVTRKVATKFPPIAVQGVSA
jgi:hypothetical protein